MSLSKSKTITVCMAALTFFMWMAPYTSGENVYHYNSLGRRDPFVPLVGIALSVRGAGLEGIAKIGDVSLEGVMLDKTTGEKSVIINGEILKKGEKVGRLAILEIGYNSVRISIEDKEYELELYE